MNCHHRWMLYPIIIFVLALIGAPGQAAVDPAVFRFPLFDIPGNLDPLKEHSVSVNHVLQQVCDGLVAFDSNQSIVPGLAESWTVSRDGRVYHFKLRDGVRFHNGKELTSQDVAASLTRIFHPDNKLAPTMLLEQIDGANAYREGKAESVTGIVTPSDGSISIHLIEPHASFLATLAMPLAKIFPRAMLDDPMEPLNRHPVGTGPFKFVTWKDDVIELESNKEYFLGRPILDGVRFVFYPQGDRNSAFQDFLDGKLDGTPLPSSQDQDDLREKGFQVLNRPRLSLLFYGMNTRIPPLDNPDVRKALALAYDRKTHVLDDLGGIYFPAFQILPPGMPGYTPENALLKYDPEAAAELLKQAGYPGGKGLPELTIASASHSDFAKKELKLFAQDLARIGVKVNFQFVDGWDKFTEGLKNYQFPLFRYAMYADIPDPDDFISPLFTGNSPINYTGFNDSSLNSILRDARRETDPVRRIGLYRKAEQVVLEAAPAIPVLFISTQVVFQANVSGIDLPATGTTYLPLRSVGFSR